MSTHERTLSETLCKLTAKVTLTLTKRTVDTGEPEDKSWIAWDDKLPDFGVRVHPSGRKVYIVKYRHEGRAVKATIGPHGSITTAAARARAAEIVTLARTGRDLEGKTPRKAGGSTMADLARRFLDEYSPGHLKPGTAALYRKIIGKRILPRLGRRRVADISRADAASLHHDMRSVPGHANRTLGVLSRMLTLAEVWEMRPEGVNPCRFVKKYPERRRERFLSDDEYCRLGAALRDAEREGFASPAAVAAIRLLMLTGCRSGEILSLQWEDVDLDRGELRLPDSKTGARIVHLGDPAIEVLRGIPRREDRRWVIPGLKRGTHLAFLHGPWRLILERAGIKNLRIHDLRHSFASGGLLVGEGLPMIGKLLGHNRVQTTARYAHRQRSRQIRRQPHFEQNRRGRGSIDSSVKLLEIDSRLAVASLGEHQFLTSRVSALDRAETGTGGRRMAGLGWERVNYTSLNTRGKRVYNFQKVSAVLADYGFKCIRLSGDSNGADFLAYHMPSDDQIPVRPKTRLTVEKKYENKGLWIAFPVSEDWYLLKHDKLRDIVGKRTPALENEAWRRDGRLSWPSPTKALLEGIEPYRIGR